MTRPSRVLAQAAESAAPAAEAADRSSGAGEPAEGGSAFSDVNTRSLGFLIQDVARLLRSEFGRKVGEAGLGLTTGEARALVHTVAAAGARQTEIAERMGVEPMTLCGYVDKLEAHGYVERRPHPDDKRAKRIVPSKGAAEAIDTIMPLARGATNAAVEGLSEEDIAAFRRVLEHMHTRLTSGRGR
ncbi:MAG: MarR family winged helix-turn-helix transcriptional regulator [Pseudomonadota bacterium]